jgi:ADP-heptose:LPS heptosyltransferase
MRQKGRIVLECDARLVPLFQRSFPEITVYARRPEDDADWLSELEPVDVQIALGSLPQHYRRRAEDFPRRAYLRADPARVEHWRQRLAALGPGRKVGISWRGGTVNSRRALRSIPLAQWLPILQQPGAQFISLQYTDCRSDLADLQARHGATVHHWQEAIDDYDETAALVAALDLVISVQTSVVHLAGALGRRVWAIVPRSPEWRYGNRGETMPWYADVHLVRQRQAKGWEECIDTVSARLRQSVEANRYD